MRRISFAKTTQQIRDRTKTVTRRLGWWDLKKGTFLLAVDKGRGLKKGQKAEILGVIEVTSATSVTLSTISQADVIKEGFPGMTPKAFVEMFVERLGGEPKSTVRRIEWKYRDDLAPPV